MRFANEDGWYELNPFPGCNQICISNHAFIYPDKRGQGMGQRQHLERLAKAKELGYDMIVCTVRDDNPAEIHILEKNGWTWQTNFLNKETGHCISLYTRGL